MIKVQDHILPSKSLASCQRWLDRANWQYGWQSNQDVPYGHWNVDITKTGSTNPTNVANKLPPEFQKLWQAVNKEFFGNSGWLTRCYANRHTFGTEGYIHRDSPRPEDQTVVIYMNPSWEPNWGGETLFYTPDCTGITHAVIPQYGRTVVFPGTLPHCARSVTRICPEVRTTLMFKVTIDPKALYLTEDLLSQFLSDVGAHQKPHRNGSLKDHLMRCYHLMKATGFGDTVALAVGLHSVYGTNAYKSGVISLDSTLVEEMFGAEVDSLVRLFATINRPDCLENPDGTLDPETLFLLQCMECVNLHDQGELSPETYPNLCKLVADLKQQRTQHGN